MGFWRRSHISDLLTLLEYMFQYMNIKMQGSRLRQLPELTVAPITSSNTAEEVLEKDSSMTVPNTNFIIRTCAMTAPLTHQKVINLENIPFVRSLSPFQKAELPSRPSCSCKASIE